MLANNIDRLLDEALSKKPGTRLDRLLGGYRLSAQSEGKSPNSIAIVAASVRYLEEFLRGAGLSTNARPR